MSDPIEVLPKANPGIRGGPKRQPVRWAAAGTAAVAWVVALIEWLTAVDIPASLEALTVTLVAAILSGFAAQRAVTPSYDEGGDEDDVDLSDAMQKWMADHADAPEPGGLVTQEAFDEAVEATQSPPGDSPAPPPTDGPELPYGPLDGQ